MAYCEHKYFHQITADGEPVVSAHDVATVALCRSCGVHLPVQWGCEGCEFIEIPEFGEPRWLRFVEGQPCVRHTQWRPPPVRGGLSG